jgi:hypothetical protein
MNLDLNSLVQNPPFCNYVFNYILTKSIVESDKNSCKVFFATEKYFSKLQTKKVNKYKSTMTF